MFAAKRAVELLKILVGGRQEPTSFLLVGAASFFELIIAVSCLVVWYTESLIPVLRLSQTVALLWHSCKLSILLSVVFFLLVVAIYAFGGRKRYWLIPFLLAFTLCTASFFYLSDRFLLNFMEEGTVRCMRLTVLWCDTFILAAISSGGFLLSLPGVKANMRSPPPTQSTGTPQVLDNNSWPIEKPSPSH